MAFPEWVERQKTRGLEIKEIRGNYYVYERKSRWDPKKKKAVKVTGEYLGKLTPDGLVPKRKRIEADMPVFSYEYGATKFLSVIAGDLLGLLKDQFDSVTAERVWATAMLKLISPCPFRRVGDRYETSFMSKMLPGLAMSQASMTSLLDRVGRDRASCADFMREAMAPAPYILIDGTGTQSSSKGVLRSLPGHSKSHGFLPQVNQIYALSISEGGGVPAFYRNVSGNIPDVTAFELTIEDAEIEGVTVIADAGFASGTNFEMLAESDLSYIVPLRRNTLEITIDEVVYEGVFTYHHRAVSSHDERRDGYRLCVFRDEKLRANEMADFVGRGEKSNATKERRKDFDPETDLRDIPSETAENAALFGTVILRTSIMDAHIQKIYEMYKLRWEIEQLFDTMRNTIDADTSCMHDDVGFEAWSFINHVMLIAACRILEMVRAKNLAKEYSIAGVMDVLSRVHMVQVAGEWMMAETTRKTKKMLKELGIVLDVDTKSLFPKAL